jgi:hypothetical protein
MHETHTSAALAAARRRPSRRALAAVTIAAIGAAMLGTGGCATSSEPSTPQSMKDPQANFANYHTFGWTEGGTPDPADPPLQILDTSLRAAISAELTKRGYTQAATGAKPDLRIAYETAAADKLENNPVRIGIGVGGWGGNNVGGSVNVGSPSVRNYREGTLVVHAVDTARNAEVWQGRVSKKITKGSLEPAAINQAVAVAMQDFPARSAGQ